MKVLTVFRDNRTFPIVAAFVKRSDTAASVAATKVSNLFTLLTRRHETISSQNSIPKPWTTVFKHTFYVKEYYNSFVNVLCQGLWFNICNQNVVIIHMSRSMVIMLGAHGSHINEDKIENIITKSILISQYISLG